jgi:hypothetical protein
VKASGIIGVGMAGVLSACVGTPAAEAPTRASLRAGDVPVVLDGASLAARVVPGGPGTVLTRAGAVAVQGMTVTVGPLGLDQGKLAKAAATQACAGQGGAFNPAATGRFAGAQSWEFRGACA